MEINKINYVKIEIDVPSEPIEYVTRLKEALGKVPGCAFFPGYDNVVYLSKYTEFFRPLDGADPTTGKIGEIFKSPGIEIQLRCEAEHVNEAVEIIRKYHPYEVPVVNIIPLVNDYFDSTFRIDIKKHQKDSSHN